MGGDVLVGEAREMIDSLVDELSCGAGDRLFVVLWYLFGREDFNVYLLLCTVWTEGDVCVFVLFCIFC